MPDWGMGLLVGLGVDSEGDELAIGVVVAAVLGNIGYGLLPAGNGEGVELSGVGEGVFGPALQDDVEGLFKKGVVLFLVPAVGVSVEVGVDAVVDAAYDAEVDAAFDSCGRAWRCPRRHGQGVGR